MALVGMLTLETAGVLLLARIFKAGFLADFLSRTVLVGFLTGVGIQVGVAMLGDMLGVAVASRHTAAQLWEVALAAPSADGRVVGVSIFAAGSILLARRFAPRFPAPLVLVVGAIAASAWLDLAARGFAVIGQVPGGLPWLKWPNVSWSDTLALTPVAASCFVMIIAQSAATARIYAVKHKERVDENADILGLSAANAAAGLSGAFVVNGSPTQTAMAEGAGARSQVAQLVFAAVVAVVLLFLTGPLQYLPRCVLASIVFTIAVGMVDVEGMSAIKRESRGESSSGSVHRRRGAGDRRRAGHPAGHRGFARPPRPPQLPAARDGACPRRAGAVGAGRPGPYDRSGAHRLPVGADLFYANADRFADEVRALVAGAPEPVRWFIIDCAAIFDVDYTAARTVRDLIDGLKSAQVGLVLARVNAFLHSILIGTASPLRSAKTGSSKPCMRRSRLSARAGASRARTPSRAGSERSATRPCYAGAVFCGTSGMNITVIGAGAIGGHIAARLAAAGEKVSVIARGAHLKAIRERGLILKEGGEQIVARVEASDRIADAGRPDLVVLGVKAHQLAPIAADVASILRADTMALTTQNGIPWWYFFKHGGPLRGPSARKCRSRPRDRRPTAGRCDHRRDQLPGGRDRKPGRHPPCRGQPAAAR